jgi:membrane-bound serine protease (ClpP class)
VLPVNIAGVAQIALAVALFIADVFASTHGVLTAGGILAFFIGSLMLFDRAATGFSLSVALILPATLITAAFFGWVIGSGLRAQLRPVRTGRESMLGSVGTAESAVDAAGGRVFVEGEHWNACSDTPVQPGQQVEIVRLQGLTLHVKPKP